MAWSPDNSVVSFKSEGQPNTLYQLDTSSLRLKRVVLFKEALRQMAYSSHNNTLLVLGSTQLYLVSDTLSLIQIPHLE